MPQKIIDKVFLWLYIIYKYNLYIDCKDNLYIDCVWCFYCFFCTMFGEVLSLPAPPVGSSCLPSSPTVIILGRGRKEWAT